MYIGPEKIIVVLVIALIVLGPERLPQVARQAGRAYREFRRVTSGLEAEVRDVFHEPIRQAFSEPQPAPPAASQGGEQAAPQGALPPPAPVTPTVTQPAGTPAGDPSLN